MAFSSTLMSDHNCQQCVIAVTLQSSSAVINGVQPSELVVNIHRQLRRQQLFISVW